MCAAFLLLCALHFDGRFTVCRLVKSHNPWPIAVKMWCIWQIAPYYCIAALLAPTQRHSIEVWHMSSSESDKQILQIVAFFLSYAVQYTDTVGVY